MDKIDKKKKVIKEKFKSKLEVEKRKKDFLKNIQDLRQAHKEILDKNKELKKLIKQENISQKQNVKQANIKYKKEIQNQKQEIIKHKDLIQENRIKFQETAKIEIARLRQEELNQKLKYRKDLINAKKQTRKLIFENKKAIQKIKQENKKVLLEQKSKHDEKKTEIAKAEIIHLENLAIQKKEFENIKKQHILNRLNLYKELKQIQNDRLIAQRNQKHDIDMQVAKETISFGLDKVRIKNEKISYSNLLKIKKVEAKIKAEKIKLEMDVIKHEQMTESIKINKSLIEEETAQRVLNKVQAASFISEGYKSNSSLVDQKSLPLQINLENDTIKGIIISEVGKKAIKVFNKLNVSDKFYSLKKAKISKTEKTLIEKFRKLKTQNSLVPINDYVQIAAFMQDAEVNEEKVHAIIVSIIYNLVKGKIFSFLGGYFSVIKIKGYKKIVYSKTTKSRLSRFSVINLPESEVTKEFEKLLVKKLNNKPFIKISENIALTNVDNEIKVITDIAFMR